MRMINKTGEKPFLTSLLISLEADRRRSDRLLFLFDLLSSFREEARARKVYLHGCDAWTKLQSSLCKKIADLPLPCLSMRTLNPLTLLFSLSLSQRVLWISYTSFLYVLIRGLHI